MMKTVTCLGIACLDFIYQVDEIPKTAEKYRASSVKIVGGGLAGNAAVACARLGAKTHLITRLGDDDTADIILTGLEIEAVNTAFSRKFQGHNSPISSIFVDKQGERMIMSYSDHEIPKNADWLPDNLAKTSHSVHGDTRWEVGAIALFKQAKSAGIPSVLDADRGIKDLELLHIASHVGFSAQGLREITGIHDLKTALQSLDSANWVAVTDGANGVFTKENGQVEHCAAFPISPVDTLGAGDTWHGALAVALAEKQPIARAVRFANAASALKCLTFGGRAGIPTREKVEAFLKGV
jgi:sulfofructose kinase